MTQPTSPADRPTFIRHQLLRKARLLANAAPTGVAQARKRKKDPEGGVAMRTPHGRAAGSPLAVPAAPAAAVIALRRMGFGPWPGDIDAFNTLGGNDAQRMEAYVDQQLDPGQLVDGTDLAVTTDFRRILTEILIRRLGNPRVGEVFPGYTDYQPLGVVEGEDLPPDFSGKIFDGDFESGGLSRWGAVHPDTI